MYCARCGRPNPERARYCSNCGAPLTRNASTGSFAAIPNERGAGQGGETTSIISPVAGEPEYPDEPSPDYSAADTLPPGTALLVVLRGPNAGSRFLLDEWAAIVEQAGELRARGKHRRTKEKPAGTARRKRARVSGAGFPWCMAGRADWGCTFR
jgi:hypothetical protein